MDVASQLDLNKALELNGEKLLDKPMKIARAKVREVDLDKKKKSPQEVQKSAATFTFRQCFCYLALVLSSCTVPPGLSGVDLD